MATPTRSLALRAVLALVALAVSAFTYLNQAGQAPVAPAAQRAPSVPTAPSVINARLEEVTAPKTAEPAPSRPQAEQPDGTTVKAAQLPAEAQATLKLIDQGGPFPYDRDGIEFQNREGRLPSLGRGGYREYTVQTPGASNRGARRIIQSEDNERYYTDDHYETFKRIVP